MQPYHVLPYYLYKHYPKESRTLSSVKLWVQTHAFWVQTLQKWSGLMIPRVLIAFQCFVVDRAGLTSGTGLRSGLHRLLGIVVAPHKGLPQGLPASNDATTPGRREDVRRNTAGRVRSPCWCKFDHFYRIGSSDRKRMLVLSHSFNWAPQRRSLLPGRACWLDPLGASEKRIHLDAFRVSPQEPCGSMLIHLASELCSRGFRKSIRDPWNPVQVRLQP